MGNAVTEAAISQLGKPYVFDTPLNPNDPNPVSHDCSGLTMWCYAKIGVRLSHYSGDQYHQLSHRPLAQAQPGDLLFWGPGEHVAIFMGNGQLIEAPEPGKNVRWRAVNTWQAPMPDVGICPAAQKNNTVDSIDNAKAIAGDTSAITGSSAAGVNDHGVLSWITSARNWARVGIFLLGGILLAAAVYYATENMTL